MKVVTTEISDILLLEPQVFTDSRGFFFESYNQQNFTDKLGITVNFVQDNHSFSQHNVLRGLHYQIIQPQGKLVRAIVGTIFDVAVDIRKSSPTFGQWVGYELSAENKRQLWIPPGFAHGFVVLSEVAEVVYKTTDYYAPGGDRTILWNDPDLAINWPLKEPPILSAKDSQGQPLKSAEVYE
ncbi:dTDP-4-dehydrorhamnose 3,5-epimerase [Trichormus variabilis ATCC 29413]|uniref:dTDP-4-dehydrorhamnose 3,5-epimerase n=2 Tax=Anabaena variabilis TaxID=264691 RepID=Q3M7S5_TRIV2|nr:MULTISPECIES: dTDP-4-dehydrorhamnose 3,5-epimerase [Nostocaceae]ABA22961.1 dTDP-4-dehydrorhamnose 3,5-epimerase [Trichormus variabilis ATCC 29413]MBC1213829.1 dTDP-4-dehydrorhamnose 3,5-epimerase [Trichormus variabilis ARAD]MBC1257453.1 dTDP-4-dehydrorhamnose 3,5-epimerase [Trichormus variabilis V5]MBC1266448.1 dTDP-4-dehydrorhamnose 3,5-epimerase [Trichormus variabilis FSR]MBC1302596.1 dTDP-4-dehydrorhamnose 3,5-epimerase [Trichormus variabilis N2B]